MRILMASDGSDEAREAALYGAHIARAAGADVTLIGIAEHADRRSALEADLGLLAEEIGQDDACQVTVRIRDGLPEDQLLAETEEHFYHLVVVGAWAGQKPDATHMGSTARHLSRFVRVPLLIVTQPRATINRVLVCTSGEVQGESDARVGGALSALVGARVAVLHVMRHVPPEPGSAGENPGRDALDLMQAGAREGEHFKRLQAIMQSQGLMAIRCQLKVRHGPVLDEILAETREGSYDLVVIGAHQASEGRAKDLRMVSQANITDEILAHVRRPVLVVRAFKPEEWTLGQASPEAQVG